MKQIKKEIYAQFILYIVFVDQIQETFFFFNIGRKKWIQTYYGNLSLSNN